MKRFFSTLLILSFVFILPIISFADSYGSVTNVQNGVARIYAEFTYADVKNDKIIGSGVGSWTGSAFAVGKKDEPVRFFVTNRHCVEAGIEEYYDESGAYIQRIEKLTQLYIMMDDSGTKSPVDIVAVKEDGADLAIVRLRDATTNREACVLHPYEEAKELLNVAVHAIGYPGAMNWYTDNNYLSSVESSLISDGKITREVDSAISSVGATLLLTDASINHGNSGGPLVDDNGTVVGVCTYGVTLYAGSIVQGMNAAVSVKELIKFLDKEKIPYLTTDDIRPTYNWVIYAILGAAIVAVVAVVIVTLRKNKAAAAKKAILENEKEKQQEKKVETRVLVGVSGPLVGKRYPLKANDKLIIGRDQNQCNVVFPDSTAGVSRVHCSITFDGRTAVITDLKSSHGTYVDKKKLTENVGIRLHRGLSIDIGSEKNRFTLQ